jgi:localization factor PodJL
MNSGGPWNLRGLRPETREAARKAAEKSGLSVGEWLNSVIKPSDEEDGKPSDEHSESAHQEEHPPAGLEAPADDDGNSTGLGDVHGRLKKLSLKLEGLARDAAAPRSLPTWQSLPSQGPGEPSDASAPWRNGIAIQRRATPDSRATRAQRSVAAGRNRSVEDAVAEIIARQLALDGVALPAPSRAPIAEDRPASFDLTSIEEQLRQITVRIEALRPASDIEAVISAVRSDLAEIGRQITEALPRRAVESLEIEVKALAQRIDHSRESGVEPAALSGLERGLSEVVEALRGLTTAENLVGFDEAVQALARKVDLIVAKDDPAALHQLDNAISGLRGIVSHVASNDTLTKVAEDVRLLAAKVDRLANSAVSSHALTALENRIDTLAAALNASAEAGHAVPQQLEKLLSGVIDKLEWVQLTHTDHAALAHLEDRIATLVKRFDTSDARLGNLEAIERGLADLLVHLDQIRGSKGETGVHRDAAARAAPAELMSTQSPELAPAWQEETDESTPADVPAAVARSPIVPDLPPNQPLEPGFTAGRAAAAPSAADRVAASEAALGSAKPTAVADRGGKPDFIAAARRAAQAAAAASADRPVRAAAGANGPKKSSQRLHKFIVAAAAVLIVAGCLRIATRFFEDGRSTALPGTAAEKMTPPAPALPQPNSTNLAAPDAAPPEVPTAPPQTTTDAPPSAAPDDTKPATPGQQSNSQGGVQDSTEQPVAPAATPPAVAPSGVTPPATDNPATNAIPAPPSSPDITGSLPPKTAAPSAVARPAASAIAVDDRLPPTIGGPALRAAASTGDASAAYEVATRYMDGRNVAQNSGEAARWFERAAKQGLAPAQFRLGALYEKGVGVKKDLARARDLYLAAAEKGNGKAMYNLAVLYAEGINGPADFSTAAHWFRKAADRGVTDSQYNLAILYVRGVGVEQSYADAYKWFALAANQGDKNAAKNRDEVVTHLDAQALAAERLAVQTWSAEPQPQRAITVKAPKGGWDAAANNAPAANDAPAASMKPQTLPKIIARVPLPTPRPIAAN